MFRYLLLFRYLSFVLLSLSIRGSIRVGFPEEEFPRKKSFTSLNNGATQSLDSLEEVFQEHDDWSFGDKLEEMEIDEEVIATDPQIFSPPFDIDRKRTKQIVHKAKRVRYRRKGQNGRKVIGVVKSRGGFKSKYGPKPDNNTNNKVVTDKKYGIVGSMTKTMPCCTESIGNYACSLMRNKNPLKFKNRCRNDADFGIIQCCRSCNTNVVELGSFLFSLGLRSKHCFDRHNRKFCAHFVYQSGMWSANQRKQLNCDGESASLAFRICRRSCGFCDPELYQSPNISPNCTGTMAAGVDSSGRIATVNSTTTTPSPNSKNKMSPTPAPSPANTTTNTSTTLPTSSKSISTCNSTSGSSPTPPENTTLLPDLNYSSTDYPQPNIIALPTIPKITIVWRKVPPPPPPPNPVEVVGPVPELPEIPYPEITYPTFPEIETTEFPEWPYPLPINVIENFLDGNDQNSIEPDLLEKILPTSNDH